MRTECHTDSPPMYLFGNGYFFKGAEVYFNECNHEIFGIKMDRNRNSEFRQKLQAYSYVDADFFEQFDPNLLNVQNGVLNLKTKELLPHDPKYKMTSIIPVIYDPNAEYGFFEDFVSQIVDKSDVKVVQEMLGYCIYRRQWLQKAFLLHGSGANGKGVLCKCIEIFLGTENCSFEILESLNSDKYRLAQLHKKYVNISTEQPYKKLTTTNIFKAIRGGDRLSAENKYGQPFNFVPYAKMIFSANQIPTTPDTTHAFWRSWILLNFPNKFEGKDCIENYEDELTNSPEKLSGILNYAIEGLQRLFEQKKFSYSKTAKDIENEWTKLSDSVTAFIWAYFKEDVDGELLPVDIWNKYLEFCTNAKINAVTEEKFWRSWNNQEKGIASIYPEVVKKQYGSGNAPKESLKGKYYWKGIKFLLEY